MAKVLQAYSLFVNWNCQSENLEHRQRKKKNKWPEWSVIKINRDFENKGASLK